MKRVILQAFGAVTFFAVLGFIGRLDFCDQKFDACHSAALAETLNPAPLRIPSLKNLSLSPGEALAQLEQERAVAAASSAKIGRIAGHTVKGGCTFMSEGEE